MSLFDGFAKKITQKRVEEDILPIVGEILVAIIGGAIFFGGRKSDSDKNSPQSVHINTTYIYNYNNRRMKP